jgi:hypothetical protein
MTNPICTHIMGEIPSIDVSDNYAEGRYRDHDRYDCHCDSDCDRDHVLVTVTVTVATFLLTTEMDYVNTMLPA